MKNNIQVSLLVALFACAAFTANAASGITDTQILIGSSLPLEGPMGIVGSEVKQGMDACFASVNSSGGVNGRTLKLISYNDSYDPATCVANTQKLIDEDKVFALCNYVGTPTCVKAQKVWQDKQVPAVGFYTGSAALREPFSLYNIHVRASYRRELDAIVDAFVKNAGVKKIAIFYQNDAFGEAVKTAALNAMSRNGITPVASASYERGSVNISDAFSTIKDSQPDAVIMAGTHAPLSKFVKFAKGAHMDTTLFHTVSFVGPETFAKELGSDSKNVFVTQVIPPFNDGSVAIAADYISALKKFASDATPSYPEFEGYLNARVLVEGLKRGGKDLTTDGFIKAVESISNGKEALGGLDVSYSATNHKGIMQAYITRIKSDGSYELVTDWSEYKR